MIEKQLVACLEVTLARLLGRRHCVFVSRGTTAIYLALKALGITEGKVVVPSMMCLSAVNAVIYAGAEPLYCDISLSDFNMDIDDLKVLLKAHRDIRAVLLPHMYGYSGDIRAFEELLKKHNVFLIEDAAQALGGSYKDKPFGSFGDLSVLSFGHTKIIDAGGGGAVLFDDDQYTGPLREGYRQLEDWTSRHGQLEGLYGATYYKLIELTQKAGDLKYLFSAFPDIFRDVYLYKGTKRKVLLEIIRKLKELPEIVNKRNSKEALYRRKLRHKAIRHPEYVSEGVCWRCSFMIESPNQQDIAEWIRSRRVDVSNWYPPVHQFYQYPSPSLKKSQKAGTTVFNLWVDEKISLSDIARNAQVVMKAIERFA